MASIIRTAGYGHRIAWIGPGHYRLFWTFDTKHGRVRFPRQMRRDTDSAGAERFSKKWNVPLPEPKEP